MADTQFDQPVKRTQPFERAEHKHHLHESRDPRLAQKQQPDQGRRDIHTCMVSVAHEVRAKDNQAENYRDVERDLLHSLAT